MKKALLSLTPDQLEIVKIGLYALKSVHEKKHNEYGLLFNTQPSETVRIITEGESYQAFKREAEATNALLRQILYQEKLLKKPVFFGGQKKV